MSAIPSPALALTRAFDRFERSGARALAAASEGDAELGAVLVDQSDAKREVQAALAIVRFSDDMWRALTSLGHARAIP